MQAARSYRYSITLAACGLAILTLPPIAFSQSPSPPAGFHFRPVSDKSLGLWEGDKPVFVFNHADIDFTGQRRVHAHSNYIHPLYGLDGEVLSDDFPADHFHHRGLYWAWPHVKIGDREYDLWSYRGIRYSFQRWLAQEATPERARLGVENGWFVGDKQVAKEEAWFDIHPATADGRIIDIALTWTPIDEPITLWGAAGKSYGGFVFRFAPRTGTIITTPDGPAKEDIVVTKLPWADLTAQFKGPSGPSGGAVFVSPDHPDFPPEWMARDYGVLAVGWPGVKPKTLEPGQPTTLKYRVWIHRGAPDVAALQKQFDTYQQSAAREKQP